MPQLQASELAALGVGGEGGEPVPVDVGEPQLRPGMRPLLADDDTHPGRPAAGVQQPGDVRDPRPVPELPVAVIGRCPGLRRDLPDRPARSGCSRSTAMSARQSPPSASAEARSATILPGSCTARGARHGCSAADRPRLSPVTRTVSHSSTAPA